MDEEVFYKAIDAKPKKRILENKANNCTYPKAIGEIVDNCLDYWRELYYPYELRIEITNKNDADRTVEIAWNMFIPENRWEPLIRPGDQAHQDSMSIGVWGEGFKIAIFAIGREIKILTKESGTSDTFSINFPREWLNNDDWIVAVNKVKTVNIPANSSMVRLRYGPKPLPALPDDLMVYLAETFGTRMLLEKDDGHIVTITVDGREVKPKSYALKKDIEAKYAFPPGMEPSEHVFEERGVSIRMIAGLLSEADAQNYGVYMYGNGRLFASRLHDERVGFGAKANSKIPQDHPHAKRLQIHIFFEGSPDIIPWAAPLKDNFNHEAQPFGPKIPEWIEKYVTPYAIYVKNSLQSEIMPYSKKWQELPEEKKIERFFSKQERAKYKESEIKDMWKKAPPIVKNGLTKPPEIEKWDHNVDKHRPRDALKWESKLVKKVTDLFDQRDKGRITSVDVANSLVKGEMPISTGPIDLAETEPGESRKGESWVPQDVTKTMTIHMNSAKLRALVKATGKTDPEDLIEHISNVYQELCGLADTPYFKEHGMPRNDAELIIVLKKILSE